MAATYIVFLFVMVILVALAWSFYVLIAEPRHDLPPEEIAALQSDIQESLAEQGGTGGDHVVAITQHVSIRVTPFRKLLPGFALAPAKVPAVIGLVGTLLVIGTFTWCVFSRNIVHVETGSSVGSDQMDFVSDEDG